MFIIENDYIPVFDTASRRAAVEALYCNNAVWTVDPMDREDITVITHNSTGYHAKIVKLDVEQ
jgi:hypothetical protein